MTESPGDISVDLQGSLAAQKEHGVLSVEVLSLPDGHIVQHFWCCNLSEINYFDLFTSFNGMNLNMWPCPSSSQFGMVFVGFQEHYTSTI